MAERNQNCPDCCQDCAWNNGKPFTPKPGRLVQLSAYPTVCGNNRVVTDGDELLLERGGKLFPVTDNAAGQRIQRTFS